MGDIQQLMLDGFSKLTDEIGKINYRLNSMEQRLESIEQKQDSMGQRLESIEQKQDSMDQHLLRMENKLDDNLGAIYDFREVISDKVSDIAKALNRIETRMDKTELRALQSSLLANRINIK